MKVNSSISTRSEPSSVVRKAFHPVDCDFANLLALVYSRPHPAHHHGRYKTLNPTSLPEDLCTATISDLYHDCWDHHWPMVVRKFLRRRSHLYPGREELDPRPPRPLREQTLAVHPSTNCRDCNGCNAPRHANANAEDIARTHDPEVRTCWAVLLRWLVSPRRIFGLGLARANARIAPLSLVVFATAPCSSR